jgi:hypothetical protein
LAKDRDQWQIVEHLCSVDCREFLEKLNDFLLLKVSAAWSVLVGFHSSSLLLLESGWVCGVSTKASGPYPYGFLLVELH